MKVYLAAPFSSKDLINSYAKELRDCGITVTSRWLDEPHKSSIQIPDLTYEQHQTYAMQDVADVAAADVFVFFNDPTKTIIRAGRHVEFGIAVALGTARPFPIYVVGTEKENIFHHLSQVYHFPLWTDVKNQLLTLSKVEKADIRD